MENTTVDYEAFRKDLIHLIGRHGLGKESNTPCDILADLLLGSYTGFRIQTSRRDERKNEPCKGCGCAEPAEDKSDEESPEPEGNFIVIKYGKKPGKHTVFVEWRSKIPIFAKNADVAMIFAREEMAEWVAEKLGKGWEVLDLDAAEHDNDCRRRLLMAIFGTDDAEEGDE